MKALTEKEILNELKRLGINSASDLKRYLKEYKTYNDSLYNLQKQKIILKEWEKATSYLKNNIKRNNLS
ncbi:MAG: hypothetical protein ACXACY_30285 [Candidatus Hodarchaeales archaeon]